MLEKGYSIREIAAKVGCKSHTTIVRLKKKYEVTGKIQNKSSSGHPCKLNEHEKCNIVRSIMTKECSNAVQIQKSLKVNDNIKVSVSTVHRALKRNGLLVARVKHKKLLLSRKHCKKCLKFAKRYKDWTVSDWNKVV
ncbi:hypothetical protein RclHR1_08740002 [Rhizophagus clarus]|uniref:Transposase Tc1-like domain-containing protein n=1 Tax=Rhizophagus clarus TaxID=94130 RepID=A0A2Z6SGT5_9GLOM|nr:hypothetical protein RclHR1_08740002 [Rhizophagus clarus]